MKREYKYMGSAPAVGAKYVCTCMLMQDNASWHIGDKFTMRQNNGV